MKEKEPSQGKDSLVPEGPESFFRKLRIEFLIHELKDPMAVIETGVRALLERPDKYGALSERQEKTLQRILRNSRKAREMLYDLLEVGRSEAGFCICCRFQPIRTVHEILIEALEAMPEKISETLRDLTQNPELDAYLQERGIRVVVAPDVFDTEVLQDESKFRSIVGNLVKNALHHRKKSMEIRIEKKAPQTLCICVIDDGPGIDPKHHQMIFQRYAQVTECAAVERKGHGLGLAGALTLARCLGGDITITSEKGQGATFELTLPVSLEREGS